MQDSDRRKPLTVCHEGSNRHQIGRAISDGAVRLCLNSGLPRADHGRASTPRVLEVSVMEHVVFFSAPDGSQAFRRLASLQEAVDFVEHMRNERGVEHVSVHSLSEVPLAFRTVYRVEVAGSVPAPSVPVEGPVEAAPSPEPAVAVEEPVVEAVVEPVVEPVVEAVVEPVMEAPVAEEAPAQPEPVAAGSDNHSLGFFAG